MCRFGNRPFTTFVSLHKFAMTSTQMMARYRREDVRHKDHPDHQRYLNGEFDNLVQVYDNNYESNGRYYASKGQYYSSEDGKLWGRCLERGRCQAWSCYRSSQPVIIVFSRRIVNTTQLLPLGVVYVFFIILHYTVVPRCKASASFFIILLLALAINRDKQHFVS